MRPTVNDIAREAGVSLATVDRVLNARPGVREKTIRVVNEAIERLGYVRDMAAANLARQRDTRLAFFLPDTASQFVETLVAALDGSAVLARGMRAEILLYRFPAEDPHALAALLAKMSEAGVEGVALMAPETPILRDAIRSLRLRGIAVVAMVSDLPNTARDHFVGIDNRAAGRTAGVLMGRFLGPGAARVMVLGQSMQLREAAERRRGFDEVMLARFPAVEVLQTLENHGRPDLLRSGLIEMLQHSGGVRGIYLLGSGHRMLTRTLQELGIAGKVVLIGHELTPHARETLLAGTMDAVITQNVGHVVRSALRLLKARTDRLPIDPGQEQVRIEIVLAENLPDQAGMASDETAQRGAA